MASPSYVNHLLCGKCYLSSRQDSPVTLPTRHIQHKGSLWHASHPLDSLLPLLNLIHVLLQGTNSRLLFGRSRPDTSMLGGQCPSNPAQPLHWHLSTDRLLLFHRVSLLLPLDASLHPPIRSTCGPGVKKEWGIWSHLFPTPPLQRHIRVCDIPHFSCLCLDHPSLPFLPDPVPVLLNG